MTSAEMSTIVEPRTVVVRSLKNPIVMTAVASRVAIWLALLASKSPTTSCTKITSTSLM